MIVSLVVVLIAAEFAAGARDFAQRNYVDPCHAPADPFPQGHGIDGTLQRISLSAIDGAACKLGTGREELILSLEPRSDFGPEVRWTRATLEEALRAGLVRAIDDADHRNTIPGFVATATEVRRATRADRLDPGPNQHSVPGELSVSATRAWLPHDGDAEQPAWVGDCSDSSG